MILEKDVATAPFTQYWRECIAAPLPSRSPPLRKKASIYTFFARHSKDIVAQYITTEEW
jgi:hypothetical protein